MKVIFLERQILSFRFCRFSTLYVIIPVAPHFFNFLSSSAADFLSHLVKSVQLSDPLIRVHFEGMYALLFLLHACELLGTVVVLRFEIIPFMDDRSDVFVKLVIDHLNVIYLVQEVIRLYEFAGCLGVECFDWACKFSYDFWGRNHGTCLEIEISDIGDIISSFLNNSWRLEHWI